ncbi:MAG: class I SAM-dependent methyltransferase [Geitlerinemataceae cyanobacterium]
MNSPQDKSWNPDRYQNDADFVPVLGRPVLKLLAPQPGERILDLGCGDGALTLELRDRGVEVIGVDASPEMVATAKARGLDARVCRGQELDFDREFDAVFSNAALHWMPEARAVVRGVAKALKPGGRFVAEFGGAGNVAAIVGAIEAFFTANPAIDTFSNPWYFPTVAEYRALLESEGFRVTEIALIPRPTPLPNGLRAWLAVFADGIVEAGEADRERAFDWICDRLEPTLRDADGNWFADYVRLRFRAELADAPDD